MSVESFKPLVNLESPYGSKDLEERLTYLCYGRRALMDSLDRGEAPFASHLIYTQVLDDYNEGERELGISTGLEFYYAVAKCVVYADYGISRGMLRGIKFAVELGVPVEIRFIGQNKVQTKGVADA